MKILIVDDSVSIRKRLVDMLSEIKGIDVVAETGSGIGAILSLLEFEPDAVVLEIRMPGISGFEILETFKKTKPTLLVIIFTNYPYPQYRKKCLQSGADFFFDKSTEFHKVAEVFKQSTQVPPRN